MNRAVTIVMASLGGAALLYYLNERGVFGRDEAGQGGAAKGGAANNTAEFAPPHLDMLVAEGSGQIFEAQDVTYWQIKRRRGEVTDDQAVAGIDQIIPVIPPAKDGGMTDAQRCAQAREALLPLLPFDGHPTKQYWADRIKTFCHSAPPPQKDAAKCENARQMLTVVTGLNPFNVPYWQRKVQDYC